MVHPETNRGPSFRSASTTTAPEKRSAIPLGGLPRPGFQTRKVLERSRTSSFARRNEPRIPQKSYHFHVIVAEERNTPRGWYIMLSATRFCARNFEKQAGHAGSCGLDRDRSRSFFSSPFGESKFVGAASFNLHLILRRSLCGFTSSSSPKFWLSVKISYTSSSSSKSGRIRLSWTPFPCPYSHLIARCF